MKIKGICQ